MKGLSKWLSLSTLMVVIGIQCGGKKESPKQRSKDLIELEVILAETGNVTGNFADGYGGNLDIILFERSETEEKFLRSCVKAIAFLKEKGKLQKVKNVRIFIGAIENIDREEYEKGLMSAYNVWKISTDLCIKIIRADVSNKKRDAMIMNALKKIR